MNNVAKMVMLSKGKDDMKSYRYEPEDRHSDEMRSRSGKAEMGGAHSKGVKPLTRETAEEWIRKLENEDGTSGAHWNYDQTKQVITQKGLDCDPVEFFVAMNLMYSDYGKVAKKMGVNNLDFYVDMAKAFLDDKDAAEDKLARYYEYVVQAQCYQCVTNGTKVC